MKNEETKKKQPSDPAKEKQKQVQRADENQLKANSAKLAEEQKDHKAAKNAKLLSDDADIHDETTI